MADLTTKYLGLQLKNPIIVGASDLSEEISNLREMEEVGAAAVVYKSLFEEQIQLERAQLDEELTEFDDRHPEMISTHPNIQHAGAEEHLLELRKAKATLGIPVIASLNAVYSNTWIDYAKKIEDTGVDALELNFFHIPFAIDEEGVAIEEEQVSILKDIRKQISIPVSVKISPFYSNILNMVQNMDEEGVDGFVLFNRLFEPEINIYKEEHLFPFNLSEKGDHKISLRYSGLLYDNINAAICANTGIFSGEDVLKMILAGADCVQIVSTLYKNSISHIPKMLEEIEKWMDNSSYASIKEFQGKLSRKNVSNPFVYKRAQYVDILMNPEEIIKKYKY
ncbi:MAG: dihydroorotate dehydrogenase-like protein [Bacteroidales bacterium]